MKRLIAGVMTMAGAWGALGATFYVSPTGNDANAGTREKPFATVVRARDAVRTALADRAGTGEIRVILKDGTYGLEQPLELTSEDSGTASRPVVWSAENRTKAVLSGAVDLDWRKPKAEEIPELVPAASRAKLLVADIPGTNAIPGFFTGFAQKPDASLVFYQDGVRLLPAREPNADDSPSMVTLDRPCGKEVPDDQGTVYRDGLFTFSDRARLEKWAKEPDLWAFGYWRHHWAELQCKVLQVLPKEGKMQVDLIHSAYGLDPKGGGDKRFYVLNGFSALDRPGEIVVDRAKRRAWALPREGVTAPIRLSKGPSLVVAKNVRDVAFEGFVFELALQDGLVFRDTTNVAVRACVVRRIGGKGLCVEGGRGARIDGCDVYDIGNTAIVLRGGEATTLTPGDHIVENCHVHHHGRTANSSPGIQLIGVGNRLQRSLVHNTDSQAVTFNGNDHYIGYNVMHDLCEHNWDAGGIYGYMCNLRQRGTVIEYNVVHMTGPQPRPGSEIMAIYLDAFTSGCTVRGNIISRSRRGIFANGGNDNLYVGNLIMNASQGIYQFDLGPRNPNDKAVIDRYWPITIRDLQANLKIYTNAVWMARYPTLTRVLDIPEKDKAIHARWNVMSNNVSVSAGDCGFYDGKLNLSTNNVSLGFCKDPGFVDYDGFDWRAKKGSALAKAFPDNRFDRMGLYASKWRVSPPVKHGEGMSRPRPLIGEWPWGVPEFELTRCDIPITTIRNYVTETTNCFFAGYHITHRQGSASGRWKEGFFGFTPTVDAKIRMHVGSAWGSEKVLIDDIRVEGATFTDGGFELGYEKTGTDQYDDDVKDGPWSLGSRPHDPPWNNAFEPYGIVGPVQQNGVKDAIRPCQGEKMAAVCAERRVTQVISVKKGVPVKVTYKFLSYLPYNADWK